MSACRRLCRQVRISAVEVHSSSGGRSTRVSDSEHCWCSPALAANTASLNHRGRTSANLTDTTPVIGEGGVHRQPRRESQASKSDSSHTWPDHIMPAGNRQFLLAHRSLYFYHGGSRLDCGVERILCLGAQFARSRAPISRNFAIWRAGDYATLPGN
jgi:hypothetical protein